MSVEVYLYFNGNCRKAIEFYAQVFTAEAPRIMTYGDAPPNPKFSLPDVAKNLVIHGELNIYGSKVLFSDVFPGSPFVTGNNISLYLASGNIDKIKSIFNKLKEGGTIIMDLQETFWSKCYGNVIDKFGIQWQLNYANGEK
jgi:PhnB protein